VLVRLGPPQPAGGFQLADEVLVGLLHLPARVGARRGGEPALVVHRVDHAQAEAPAGVEVLLAERRRDVDDAGSVLGGHEVAGDHQVPLALEPGVREGGLVRDALQVGHRQPFRYLRLLAEQLRDEGLGHHQPVAVRLDERVGQLRVDGQRHVRDEGPRRGRPGQERGSPLRERSRRRREPHVHARVGHRRVPLRHLVVGEARAAPGAVGDRLEVLEQQALLVQALDRPPHGLDVLGRHREVGVGEVDPEAETLRHPLPVLHVAGDRLAATPVELGDPERLDLPLVGHADLAFDLELHGQPVAVPAGLAVDVVPGHGLEPGVQVLERAGLHVAEVRPVVRGGGTVVEDPLW
jgi:hypothetical protein